jgi:branched-chain amino acid transport system ATP-binding protein
VKESPWLVEFDLVETSSRQFVHSDRDRLSVAGLAVRYGSRVVVYKVDLRVAPGEVVVLLGHNGCGKSATLRAIIGLATRHAGEVVVDGVDLIPSPGEVRRAGVGFVPASGEVFDDLTVRENLLLGAGRNLPHEEVDRRVRRAEATIANPRPIMNRIAGTLSGGERRMVGIALALMAQPTLLLLDEPTKHLAPAVAEHVLRTVRALADDERLGVLVAEVNVAAALRVADRVYVMRSGAVYAERTAAELRAAGPRTWWTLF